MSMRVFAPLYIEHTRTAPCPTDGIFEVVGTFESRVVEARGEFGLETESLLSGAVDISSHKSLAFPS